MSYEKLPAEAKEKSYRKAEGGSRPGTEINLINKTNPQIQVEEVSMNKNCHRIKSFCSVTLQYSTLEYSTGDTNMFIKLH